MYRVEVLQSKTRKCWHVRVISPLGFVVAHGSWHHFINAMRCMNRWDKVYNNA